MANMEAASWLTVALLMRQHDFVQNTERVDNEHFY